MHAIQQQGHLTIHTQNSQLGDHEAALMKQDAGDYVILSITDTGSGMDKETRERIFDPFFSTKGENGTGLGMSQVYGFVERSNGAIKVYSEPGHGTRITLYFPRHLDNSDTINITNNSHTEDLSGLETILFVDDEPSLLNLAEATLRNHGYSVICANSAKEALEILEHNTVDVLFSDVVMPDINGYQLAREVQNKYPYVKIRLTSGFSDSHVDDHDYAHLTQNLLHKPYTSTELLKSIRDLLS